MMTPGLPLGDFGQIEYKRVPFNRAADRIFEDARIPGDPKRYCATIRKIPGESELCEIALYEGEPGHSDQATVFKFDRELEFVVMFFEILTGKLTLPPELSDVTPPEWQQHFAAQTKRAGK